jgi:hypothetical protein
MHRRLQAALVLLLGLGAGPAVAGSLDCTMVNGNVNCAGPGAHSCQTVNGQTVCSSGDGSVVQSFHGNGPPPAMPDIKIPEIKIPDIGMPQATDPDQFGDQGDMDEGDDETAPPARPGRHAPQPSR